MPDPYISFDELVRGQQQARRDPRTQTASSGLVRAPAPEQAAFNTADTARAAYTCAVQSCMHEPDRAMNATGNAVERPQSAQGVHQEENDWPAWRRDSIVLEDNMARVRRLHNILSNFMVRMKELLENTGHASPRTGTVSAAAMPTFQYIQTLHADLDALQLLQRDLRVNYQTLHNGPPARRTPQEGRLTYREMELRISELSAQTDRAADHIVQRIGNCPLPDTAVTHNPWLDQEMHDVMARYAQAIRIPALSGPDPTPSLTSRTNVPTDTQAHAYSEVLAGHPERHTDFRQGYYNADWSTLARLFQDGTPIDGNTNRRRYDFADGSRVELQAHQPVQRPRWNLLQLIYFWLPAPPALIEQGYTAHFYPDTAGTQVWGTRYFTGSFNPTDGAQRGRILDPQQLPNFAERAQDYHWAGWYFGNADVRMEQVEQVEQHSNGAPQAQAARNAEAAGTARILSRDLRDATLLIQHAGAWNAGQIAEPIHAGLNAQHDAITLFVR